LASKSIFARANTSRGTSNQVPRFFVFPLAHWRTMPTNTLSVLDWAIAIGVPLLVGVVISKLAERYAWFQAIGSKNVVMVAACALLGFALDQLKRYFIGAPDVLNQVDLYVKPFMSILAMYLATQVTHGMAKAKQPGLKKIE
jgi:hypothetical protein